MRQIGLAGALLLAACSGEEAKRAAPASEPPPAVSVAPVALRPLAGGVTVSGVLVAREEASIGAELSGYRVLRVLADEGDFVKRGETLAMLDGALLQGEIARAQVAAERARSEYARIADLKGRGVIADETIAQRGFEARSAAATLSDLRTRRARLQLRAPVAGLVLSRALRPGDVSGAGGTDPYFRIARDGLFELDAEVPEEQLARVRVGNRVPVQLATGERFDGAVRLISRRVDPQTKLGRVRILLPQDRAQRVGGFATASLAERARSVPAVPERAVQYTAGGATVSVVGDGNRVQRVPVRTGGRAGGYVELVAGPRPGTRVILGGGALVLPGDQVRPVAATGQAR